MNYVFILSFYFSSAYLCQICNPGTSEITFTSGIYTKILNFNQIPIGYAVLVLNIWGVSIQGVSWIWVSANQNTGIFYFQRNISINSNILQATLQVAGDNKADVFINNLGVSECTNASFGSIHVCDIFSYLNQVNNVVIFRVTNSGGPGGLTFKIHVVLGNVR